MNFWTRLFGRNGPQRPAIHDRRQPNDWKPGDLAVCIVPAGQWYPGYPNDPAEGDILRVARVDDAFGTYPDGCQVRSYFLHFEARDQGWEHTGFRKAAEDAAPAEAEFSEFIRRPMRAPEKVRAG